MSGDEAPRLVRLLRDRGLTLGVAESLTGGELAARIVDVPGASEVFRGGVVAYAAEAKHTVLGVEEDLLKRVGTVDANVAMQMAQGVRALFGTDIGLATTGVAGPGPAEGKPAGTVFVALSYPNDTIAVAFHFGGNRGQVRTQTVGETLALALATLARDE